MKLALIFMISVGCGIAVVHADDRAEQLKLKPESITPELKPKELSPVPAITIIQMPPKVCNIEQLSFEEAIKKCIDSAPSRLHL